MRPGKSRCSPRCCSTSAASNGSRAENSRRSELETGSCPSSTGWRKTLLRWRLDSKESAWKNLHPFERAFFPDPDVAHDQDAEEDQHLNEPENSQRLELHRPGKQEDRFDVKNDKQDGDDVVTDGVASAGVVVGIDAAFVRHELGAVRTLR